MFIFSIYTSKNLKTYFIAIVDLKISRSNYRLHSLLILILCRTTCYQPWVSKRFGNISFPELKKYKDLLICNVHRVSAERFAQFRWLS